MLQDIRETFIGTTGKIVLGIILLLLAGTGLNYTITPQRFIAKVGDEEISPRTLQIAFDNELQRFGDIDQLPRALLPQIQGLALERVITRTALLQHLEAQGYAVSDAQVARAIRDIEVFQGEDGQFDRELYRRLLGQNQLSPAAFERDQRDQMILEQFQQNVAASSFVTPQEFRRLIELSNQQREIEYATIDPSAYSDDVSVAEAEVASWYEANPTRYQTPASVDIEYLLIDEAMARSRISTDDDVLRDYYANIRDQYRGEEQRRASHILLRTDEDADAARELAASLRERVIAGESFEALAREYSTDGGSARNGGDLGWVARGDFVGPVENAVFSMSLGDISEVVQSTFGLHIIRLDDVREADAPTFEEVRADVESRYVAERLPAELLQMQEQLEDLYFERASLDQIAAALAVEVQAAEDFTEASVVPFGRAPAVTDALFGADAVAEGELSESIELDGDRTALIRVVSRTPAGRQPLEQVAEQIRNELMQRAMSEIAAERGAQLLGVLRAEPGMDFETLTLNTEAEVTPKRLIARRDAETPAALAAAAFDVVLDGDAPHIGSVSAPGQGFIIYRLTDIVPGDAADIPPEQIEAGRQQLALRNGTAQLQAMTIAIRERADVEMGDALETGDGGGL